MVEVFSFVGQDALVESDEVDDWLEEPRKDVPWRVREVQDLKEMHKLLSVGSRRFVHGPNLD